MVSIRSVVALAADHVDHSENGNDVRDESPRDGFGNRLQVDERWRAAIAFPGAAGSVGDNEEAQLAVATFDEGVGLARLHADAIHDVFEVPDHALDAVVGLLLVGQGAARIVDHDRAFGDFAKALAQDARALLDLLEPH